MEDINKRKEELEKMRRKFANKLNETIEEQRPKAMYDDSNIYIASIREDIVYWKTYPSGYTLVSPKYFYTDLEGKILFNESIFDYAAPFSNSCSLVKQGSDWYIIDLNLKEFVSLPNEITPYAASGFEMGNLIIFDKETGHWGSYYYNREDKTFQKDIPFIWDALKFAENKDFVYVGLSAIYKTPLINEDYYRQHLKDEKEYNKNMTKYYIEVRKALIGNYKMDMAPVPPIKKISDLPQNSLPIGHDNQTMRFITFKLEKKFVYDLDKYKKVLSSNESDKYQKEIIRKRMHWYPIPSPQTEKEKKEDILYTLSTIHGFGDYEYKEDYNKKFNNRGIIVDVGKMEDYKRILGKLKK